MSDTFVIPFYHHEGSADPIVTTAGTHPFYKAPSAAHGGGITILEAYMGAGQGTATFKVVDMGTAGTGNVGTVTSIAIAQTGNGASGAATSIDYWLASGKYLGLLTAAGTVKPPLSGWLVAQFGR